MQHALIKISIYTKTYSLRSYKGKKNEPTECKKLKTTGKNEKHIISNRTDTKKITEVTTAPTSAMTKTLYCSFSHPPLVRANRRHFSLAIAHMIHTH